MRNPWRLPLALAVAFLVAVAAACGGDDGPELSSESAAAVNLINAACAQWTEMVEQRGEFPIPNFDAENPSADDLPTVGDYFAEGHPARREMIAAIEALDVPDEIRERFDALVDALERGQDNAEKQAAAAQARDVEGFVATLDEADTSQQAIDEAAGELGATKCTA